MFYRDGRLNLLRLHGDVQGKTAQVGWGKLQMNRFTRRDRRWSVIRHHRRLRQGRRVGRCARGGCRTGEEFRPDLFAPCRRKIHDSDIISRLIPFLRERGVDPDRRLN